MSATSTILKILSMLIVLVGLYFGVYEGILEPMQPGHSFSTQDKIELVAGFCVIFLGMLGFVVSQIADLVSSKV